MKYLFIYSYSDSIYSLLNVHSALIAHHLVIVSNDFLIENRCIREQSFNKRSGQQSNSFLLVMCLLFLFVFLEVIYKKRRGRKIIINFNWKV